VNIVVKEYDIRKKKVEQLRQQGIEPYAYKYKRNSFAEDVRSKYSKLKKDNSNKKVKIKLAGRLMTFRNIGRLAFCHLQDSSGKIQLVFEKGTIGNENFKQMAKMLDPGDIIGVAGYPYRTKAGELSLWVSGFELLAKSLRGLPDKWHGFKEIEERYRKRYVDLIMNPEVRNVFVLRAKILQAMREFMDKNNFIEVETPLLQTVYGGAFAKPFKTRCDELKTDMYLAIAPELPLKKALVGGLDRVYEVTKKFRNESADSMHNPEHMTIEWYQAYADYNEGMDLVEALIKSVAKKLFGKLIIEYQGHKINLAKWKRIPLLTAIKKYLGEDVSRIKTDTQAKKVAKKYDVDTSGVTKGNIADELMKVFRHKLIQPTFLTDYPIELAPLAKPKRGDPTKAEIFQPFIGGMELARAYSELNDPALQLEHFKEQETERKRGNVEAMPTDKDFVTALEYGMPPACGVGIGIERVVMLFANQPSIRDVILFPMMRPKDKSKK